MIGTPGPDVLIVGAGPAGLSCAIAAAARGLSVEVADAMKPPIDKACGEGLMPDSLAALDALGVDLARAGGARIDGIRFLNAGAHAEAAFRDGSGLGVRRTLLHQSLLDRAANLGVRFRWETVVRGLHDGMVTTNRDVLRPRWIVGADGNGSRIRKAAGLDAGRVSSQRIGLQQHFQTDLWTNHVEVYWGDHGQAYVTPVSATEVCVVFIGCSRFAGLDQALSLYPALARRLAKAERAGVSRGAASVNRRLDRVTAGKIALIGDASGSVDAVTGEGLALCFRQANALADALAAGDLAGYEVAHRAIRCLPAMMSNALLLLDRSPFLRQITLATFDRQPMLFDVLLHLHVGVVRMSREKPGVLKPPGGSSPEPTLEYRNSQRSPCQAPIT